MSVILKTRTGTIPANQKEFVITDTEINDLSIIEVYYDTNEVYTVETWQSGNTVHIVTNEHPHQVGVKILINNVNSFSPYDDSEISQAILLVQNDVEELFTSIGDINSTLESHTSELTIHSSEIIDLQNNKQDVLTAGAGINIENNVISSTGGSELIPLEATDIFKDIQHCEFDSWNAYRHNGKLITINCTIICTDSWVANSYTKLANLKNENAPLSSKVTVISSNGSNSIAVYLINGELQIRPFISNLGYPYSCNVALTYICA